jgi:hypothetical protein
VRRRVLLGAAAVSVAAAGLAFWWFEPHRLFLDDVVDEAPPVAAGPPRMIVVGGTDVVPDPPPVAADPPRSATLSGIEGHDGSGTATVVPTAEGDVLRLEIDFDNGPDLRLYLSSAPADGDPDALDDDIVDLGRLKGNKGGQNYDLPAGVDLDRYPTVVIWCRRFSVGFGAGTLLPA